MTIPYGRQHITEDDIDAVVETLRSDFLTQGPIVPKFERAVADYCGARFGAATNSATSALHLACLALGVGPGDRVWTTPITFVATANAARQCGAEVDFVDIDPRTYNICATALESRLAEAGQRGRLPKVVIPVHMCGQSCEMDKLYELAQRYGFRIIEDASHAIGGTYKGYRIGSCQYSDITVFSFHPVKIITCGEGGMALTNDSGLANTMQRLRSHGITRDPLEMVPPIDGPWHYQQIDLGMNYRMTELQAALGLSQLNRLDTYVTQRHAIATQYERLIDAESFILPWQHPEVYSSFHLYVVRVRVGTGYASRKEVFEKLRNDGILVNLHYLPVYRHPYYAALGYVREEFPEAERYYCEAITLPLYPGLTDIELSTIVRSMNRPIGHQTIF